MGSVDILSARLAHIRTWTYCASKPDWVHDAKRWINIARDVEDRLSDRSYKELADALELIDLNMEPDIGRQLDVIANCSKDLESVVLECTRNILIWRIN